MLRRCIFLLFLFVFAACDSGNSPDIDPPDDDRGYHALRQLSPFPVGAAVQAAQVQNPDFSDVFNYAFNSLTAEYQMKQNVIWTSRNTYNWAPADALVQYGQDHEMQVHGHALLWHSSTPLWLENFVGSDETFEALLLDYIFTTVQRYQGKVISWDVVNEAFNDGSGTLRETVFRNRLGPDYLARMFDYARQADPDVLLFYNDYNLESDATKRRAVLAMVDDFQARGIPIDGIGLQMHVSYNSPSLKDIKDTMQAFASRGLKIHLSELDIRANPGGDLTSLTELRALEQRARTFDIVDAFLDLPAANRFAITWWGLRDPDSWLIGFWGNPEWPLLFDADYAPKPAYFGFVEALEGAS